VLRTVLGLARELVPRIEAGLGPEQRDLILDTVERVIIGTDKIRSELKRHALLERMLGGGADKLAIDDTDDPITVEASVEFARRRGETRLLVQRKSKEGWSSAEPSVLKAIARGHVWFDELVTGQVGSIAELARLEGVTDRYISQLIDLAFLPTTLVDSVLAGRQRLDLSPKRSFETGWHTFNE